MAVVRSSDFSQGSILGHCVCNIDPPASSYAIMRRACPYRGENHEPGKDVRRELDPVTGIREQNRHRAENLGVAAAPSGYRVTFAVPAVRSACLLVTPIRP